ncbi:hypothetical protein Ahy_B06g081766 isoform B [Arachis hypogaea]|uniref:Uncharacterized protein n=1 Tax=Arachis hypogaea TaxID=3818 RepID=A0A444YLZ3_ARAHY|nr:hypothetical protein Ahy_B06g081766 isoform B [Arachis hypogaea]
MVRFTVQNRLSLTQNSSHSSLKTPSLHCAAVDLTVAAWFVVVVRQTPVSPGLAPTSSVRPVRRQLPIVRIQLTSVRCQLPVVRRSPSNLWSLPSPKGEF